MPKWPRNRAKDFVDQCHKRFDAAIKQAGNKYIVKVFCSTERGEWQTTSMAPVSDDFIAFQSFNGTEQTVVLAPVEQIAMCLRITERTAEEKQQEMVFNEIGFHTFTSIKAS